MKYISPITHKLIPNILELDRRQNIRVYENNKQIAFGKLLNIYVQDSKIIISLRYKKEEWIHIDVFKDSNIKLSH